MNAVATREETQLATVADMSGGLLEVIARAARDPNVDIDKMERLFAMQERIIERQAKASFIVAKITMRAKLPAIDRRGRIQLREKLPNGKREGDLIQDTPYARFEDIHAAVMPILDEHGFDLSYRNGLAPDGKVRVTTVLSHSDGHSEETYFDLPHDTTGSKNAVQAIGSSTSYAKRYGTISILNLRVDGEDDDGKASEVIPTISDEQEATLEALIQDVGADRGRFLSYMKIVALGDLHPSQYSRAVAILEKKRGK